ncbi:MAG: trigger factor [Candidatus Phytoplasma pruni]|uniref:trigger factor n=1 Tax=Milkweed yellows phytoplasma TaxID=208434 RepID=UPI0003818806|nr:trigger factor [Milkweed yellows phytoplasma]
MQIKKNNNDFVQYHFDVSVDEFESYIKKAFDKVQPKVEIKGFRKGHAAQKVFEKHYGPSALYKDAFCIIYVEKFQEILTNKEFKTVGEPKLVDFDIEKLDRKKPFSFGLEMALKPEVKICDYQKITLNDFRKNVTDEDVQAQMDLLLKQNETLAPKKTDTPLEMGDIAIFDFKGFVDGIPFEGGEATNYSLEIGSNQFIPGFETGMLGMKREEKRDIKVVFPDNYGKKELAGKEAVFQIFLKEMKTPQKFVVTDESIKNLKLPNIETVYELKKNIKEHLENQNNSEYNNEVLQQVFEYLIANSTLKVPQHFVQTEVENIKQQFAFQLQKQNMNLEKYLKMTNSNEEEYEKNNYEQALKNVQINFLLDEVVTKENIQATPEEIERRYQQISAYYKIPIDKLKENYAVENIKNGLSQIKAGDLLITKVVFKEQKEVSQPETTKENK